MNRAVLIAFWAILALFTSESQAFVAKGDTAYFDGFTRTTYKYQQNSGNDNHLVFGMLRVNAYKNIVLPKDNGYSYLNISVVNQRKEVEVVNAYANWSEPFGVFDRIFFGRFIPPFAREWSEKSVDQLNLPGGFSPIYDQLVYVDDGAQVDFHRKRLYVSLASFLGERSGGPVREQRDGKVHLYSKGTLTLPLNLDLGGSYRWSRTRNNLWAAWVKWGGTGKNISFESVGFGNDVQWFVNYGQEIFHHCIFTARYEGLKYQPNLSTVGVRFFTRNIDMKISSTFPGDFAGDHPKRIQAELLFRF